MKQELWRPSEQVLHLLTTECKQPAVQWEQQIQIPSSPNPSLGLAVCSRRQAPAVWRPPVAMKANCPPPVGGPVDEWQLPEEQGKVVPDAFGFLDDRPRDAERNDSNVSDGSDEADEVEEEDDPPASTSAQIFDLVANRDPPPPLFMKQTTLFSGLGSVSFGSGGGFSMPASSSSIFAHSPGFGVVSLKDDEHQQHAEKEDEHDMDRDQVKSEQKMVRPRRLQRPTCTGTLSEKGSSESQTGNGKNGKAFKPSELNGKSLVDGSPAGSTPSGSKDDHGKTSGRKPRTRPLDMLMNAIKVTAPNSGSPHEQQHQQQQRQEIRAPQTRSSSRINKNRKNSEQQDVNNTTNPNSKRAYFAHTGSWIVQKKSSRIARSAFKREEEAQPAVLRRMKVASNGKGVTKKRSLTEMSQDTQAPQKRRKKGVVDGGNEEDLDGDDRQKRRSVDELGEERGKAPVIQSKRGRCQVLPSRLQDSVINKVKRTSRK